MKTVGKGETSRDFTCPWCRKEFEAYYDYWDTPDIRMCPYCGKPIDWESDTIIVGEDGDEAMICWIRREREEQRGETSD